MMDDELFSSIIEECRVKLPPFEWLWRCSEGGSVGQKALSAIDIDHDVEPVRAAKGGRTTAKRKLSTFLANKNNILSDKVANVETAFVECERSGLLFFNNCLASLLLTIVNPP